METFMPTSVPATYYVFASLLDLSNHNILRYQTVFISQTLASSVQYFLPFSPK